MKTLVTAILAVASAAAIAADPHAGRTSNGSVEMYTNTKVGQGTLENGCFLPEQYEGHPVTTTVMGTKIVHLGQITEFQDCVLPRPVVARPVTRPAPAPAPAPVVAAPAPRPTAPVVVAPAPAPVAAPIPAKKKVRE